MDEVKDIATISVPFAAGVASGTLLYPALGYIHSPMLAAMLAATIGLLAFAAVIRFDNSSSKNLVRFTFSGIFMLTGVLCALNAGLTAGIGREGGGLSRLAEAAAGKLMDVIDGIAYPSDSSGPLVKALLTGDRSGLGKDTITMFRACGASHILALSGLHLGVIYLILTRLTSPFGNSPAARKVRCSLILGAVLFYTLMTGASPSIVRAMIFIMINETAKLLCREREPVRVLLAALTIQLAVKPEVISSPGFQLSYLAMAGIFILYPILERLYPESGNRTWDHVNPLRRMWQAAAMSVSCQAFTCPLVWYRFRTFPEYFLITNLIALPVTSAIMVLSVTVIALSALGICPSLLVMANDAAVQALLFCLDVISGM